MKLFRLNNKKGHLVVMYAVKEPSKFDSGELEENLYILDMLRESDMEVLKRYDTGKGELSDKLLGLNDQYLSTAVF